MLMETKPTPRLGIAGKLTRLFLTNREISLLTILILIAWGSISFMLMPKQYNPEIVAPAFIITTTLPGASSQEVYDLITSPLEDAIAEIPEVDKISSSSRPGGSSMVTVQFFVGADKEDAKITLNQKLADKHFLKPLSASEPSVQSIDPDDVPIMDIGLTSTELSSSSLRKLAADVADELKQVENIAAVEIKGGTTNHLQVSIDAQKLAAQKISLSEVTAAIQSQNNSSVFQSLSGEERNPVITLDGSIKDLHDLQNIVIKSNGSAIVRLSDIATVSAGEGEITRHVTLHEKGMEAGAEVIHIALSKHKGTNATTVSQAAEEVLSRLEGNLIPTNVKVHILNNEGETAREEISKLTFDLIKSIVIVGFLLYIFLGLRNSLVASISIPLVLLAVFGVGLLADQTVNRITLFALILSLGLLVDDAIVVVENIARYFRLHPEEKNKIKLIVQAVNEVGGALSLSTLTMALAFLPMAFVTGMMGPYMGPIPFFVPAALLISLLLSVTINPFLAWLFLSKQKIDHSYENGFFYRAMKKVELRYAAYLRDLLSYSKKRRRFLFVIAGMIIISLILPMTPLVPFRMLPKADKDHFYIYLDLTEGSSLKNTREATIALEKSLLESSDVTSVESYIGTSQVIDFNGLFKGSGTRITPSQSTIKVHLTSHTKRDRTSEELASSARAKVDDFKKAFPDASVRLMEDPPGPPVQATFYLKIKGSDETLRENITRDILTRVENIPGIVDIKTSLPERSYDYVYSLNREKAALLGVNPSEAAASLAVALGGAPVGLYHNTLETHLSKEEQEYIMVRFDESSRNEESDLSLILLNSTNGSKIPLTEIITREHLPGSTTLLADEREATTVIAGEMEGRSVIYAVLDLLPQLLRYQIPGHVTHHDWSLFGVTYYTENGATYKVELDGEWKLTLEVFRDLGIAMGLAIFLIYFVLAANAKSLFVPLLIMVSIPLSLIGVLPGFAFLYALKGTYFNATSMIGVIALAGLAVKNAVIYLEYLEPLKEKGVPLAEALVEAGRIRLLPIVLTSLAAIFGSFTIASDPVWEGLAWAIILGLTASTLLTLLVFPVVYFVFERKRWDNKNENN